MKLSVLLGELRSSLLRDTSTLQTGPPDKYWDDATLVRYIDDAHKRFARRSLCIRDDTTPEATVVKLISGAPIYQLDASVLQVVSARHQDSQTDLVRLSHPLLHTFANPSTDYVDGWCPTPRSGQPTHFTTDEGLNVDDAHQIRMLVDPSPAAEQAGKQIRLRVIRLPLDELKVSNLNAEPEIPEDWQLDMLEWAAWRALRNWDVDAEDRAKATQHRERFEEAVIECRNEVRQRKMFQPVTWHFGSGGFGGYVR